MNIQEYRSKAVEFGYSLGWSFTPLKGKRPIVKGWQAAERETLVSALAWAASGNVGVRAGQASGGLLIVDLDTNKPDYSAARVKALDLPETVTARTGSGGWHLYYQLPEGVDLGNSAGKLAPCVDTRGSGGQIVFPGSIHPDSGEPYAWMKDREPWHMAIAILPQKFINILNGQAEDPGNRAAAGQPPRWDDCGQPASYPDRGTIAAERYGKRAMADEMANVSNAAEGTRNATLNAAAFSLGQLVGGGVLDGSLVENGLLGAALGVGLGREESLRTIASGLAKGIQEPRGVPEHNRPTARPAADRGQGGEAPAGVMTGGVLAVCDENGVVQLGEREPDPGKLVLSRSKTLPTGQAFVKQFYAHRDSCGGRRIQCYAGSLVAWENNRYVELEDGAAKSRLQPWLHDALQYVYDRDKRKPVLRGFDSNPATVSAALETIRSAVHLPQSDELPFWISGKFGDPANREFLLDPAELLPCKSMNLHIPSGQVLPATPDLFTFNALEFDYDPKPEPAKAWLKFLADLWPDDAEAIDLLQEWFGYCLTADTSLQKMLLIKGPKRSGKGTIARVLGELIGRGNVAGPTIGSLAGDFGLQPLLGKSVAMVSDARFTGSGIQAVVERLLCISGEDVITVERKHLPAVTQKLPVRFTFLTNELPRFRDAAGALANRFMILVLENSFFGKEDPKLTGKLFAELPGILVWALRGWKRLHERGKFAMPESSIEARDMLDDTSSPVSAFLRECCEVDLANATWRVSIDDLYASWRSWCEAEGLKHISTRQTFGRELSAVVAGLKVRRRHDSGRFYQGVRLRELPLPVVTANGEGE